MKESMGRTMSNEDFYVHRNEMEMDYENGVLDFTDFTHANEYGVSTLTLTEEELYNLYLKLKRKYGEYD